MIGEGIVGMPLDSLLSLKALADYSDLSVRSLENMIADPVNPLPAYQVNKGKMLVRKSEFDTWLQQYVQEAN